MRAIRPPLVLAPCVVARQRGAAGLRASSFAFSWSSSAFSSASNCRTIVSKRAVSPYLTTRNERKERRAFSRPARTQHEYVLEYPAPYPVITLWGFSGCPQSREGSAASAGKRTKMKREQIKESVIAARWEWRTRARA